MLEDLSAISQMGSGKKPLPICFGDWAVLRHNTPGLHEGVIHYALARNMGASAQMLESF